MHMFRHPCPGSDSLTHPTYVFRPIKVNTEPVDFVFQWALLWMERKNGLSSSTALVSTADLFLGKVLVSLPLLPSSIVSGEKY